MSPGSKTFTQRKKSTRNIRKKLLGVVTTSDTSLAHNFSFCFPNTLSRRGVSDSEGFLLHLRYF